MSALRSALGYLGLGFAANLPRSLCSIFCKNVAPTAFWCEAVAVSHTSSDDLDAQAVATAYRSPTSDRANIIAIYAQKRAELVEAKRARKELEGSLFAVVEAQYDKAYDRAIATRPTTPTGAAALLTIIDTDEPLIPNIIAALEGMAHG